jgi:hypothetical protein
MNFPAFEVPGCDRAALREMSFLINGKASGSLKGIAVNFHVNVWRGASRLALFSRKYDQPN